MRGFFITFFLFAVRLHAQELPLDTCTNVAEGRYMHESEGLITQYQSAQIDSAEFEKLRAHLLEQRESELNGCSELDSEALYQSAQFSRELPQRAADRFPASTNPVYEEAGSIYEY